MGACPGMNLKQKHPDKMKEGGQSDGADSSRLAVRPR